MSAAPVISLQEWRAEHCPPQDDPPPSGPFLRLVGDDERPGDERFRLEVFLERARLVMAERRPPLRVVGDST